MQTRKQLFNAGGSASSANVIPATVKFVHDKGAGVIQQLSAREKMLCALRKCLAALSNGDGEGRRFFISGNKVELLQEPETTESKRGGPQTYRAAGRCRIGVAHRGGHMTTMFIAFEITYRDTLDDRGLPDVTYIDPTSIDEIDRKDPANLKHLQ